jgi:hypothetical protein
VTREEPTNQALMSAGASPSKDAYLPHSSDDVPRNIFLPKGLRVA